jgi:hypothetical protein
MTVRAATLGALVLSFAVMPPAARAQPGIKPPRIGHLANNLVGGDPRPREAFLQGPRDLGYVDLAAKNRLPTVYSHRAYVDAGGLMFYGPDLADLFRRAATYVDKILKGAKLGDLPVEQATKFELVINVKAATALGLTIPQSLLGRADEVIQ